MDPVYSGDLFIDGFTVKAEPMTIDGASASVPIPARRLTLEFDCGGGGSGGGSYQDTALLIPGASLYATVPTPSSFWGQGPKSDPTIKMEDDDIFQVDKSDLIQGPTLAELNANDETLLEDLNFDDLLLPEENSYFIQGAGCKLSPEAGSEYLSPGKGVASPTGVPTTVAMSFPPGWAPPPQDLLCGGNSGGSSSGGGGPSSLRPRSLGLSSSAPTHLGLEQIWQRREPRQHLLSTSSLAEATSTSSLSTGGVLSPEAHDFSLDEGFDSEDDSDHYEDYSSDAEVDFCRMVVIAESGSDGEGGSGKKKERYFWQYNVQAKGPKGQRLVIKTRQEDPHHLDEVTDPVFSPQCSVQGIKHSGKARKGDGNDLTPNPRKLTAIGKELDKLNRIINDMTPVSELPFSARPKTRKEKNKLASRACRLKKKAQHEANKIKLYGLESEHKRLINGISQMKQILITRVTQDQPEPQEISKVAEKITKSATKVKIAGQTTEFVNKVLDKIKLGVSTGGLEELH